MGTAARISMHRAGYCCATLSSSRLLVKTLTLARLTFHEYREIEAIGVEWIRKQNNMGSFHLS